MTREQNIGDCEHCKKQFGYYLIHNGFNDSAYAYCDACGTTALLSPRKVPSNVNVPLILHQSITPEVEPYLAPCKCGGSFRAGVSPRCPACRQPLSPVHATDYIERQAEGTKKGWRWQRAWTGLYCIVIDNRIAQDVWRTTGG